MNAIAKSIEAAPSPLARLREPFPPHQVSKLPKPTKQQTDEVKADFKKGIRCQVCGSWHHPQVVHLDYVGHAALTDRLLEVDEAWSWEPLALRDGLPAFDATGGLWIRLTVCGVTRLGYGHAAAKPNIDPGAREKEVIGDALRNAAMRFGAALDLWHKGDLHVSEDGDDADAVTHEVAPKTRAKPNGAAPKTAPSAAFIEAEKRLWKVAAEGKDAFTAFWNKNKAGLVDALGEEYPALVAVMKKVAGEIAKSDETRAAETVAEKPAEEDPFTERKPSAAYPNVEGLLAQIRVFQSALAGDNWAENNRKMFEALNDADYKTLLDAWKARMAELNAAREAA